MFDRRTALLLCVGVAAVGCKDTAAPKAEKTATADSKTVSAKTDNKRSPAVQILSWDQAQKLVAGHKGKVVVIDVWSTYCVPCVREFPNLVKLSGKFGDRAACISFDVDYDGNADEPPESYREKVLKFLTEQHATFENVISSDPSEDFFDRIKLGGPPAVFVYDRAGKLVRRFDNSDSTQPEFTYEKDVVPFVEKLLAGP